MRCSASFGNQIVLPPKPFSRLPEKPPSDEVLAFIQAVDSLLDQLDRKQSQLENRRGLCGVSADTLLEWARGKRLAYSCQVFDILCALSQLQNANSNVHNSNNVCSLVGGGNPAAHQTALIKDTDDRLFLVDLTVCQFFQGLNQASRFPAIQQLLTHGYVLATPENMANYLCALTEPTPTAQVEQALAAVFRKHPNWHETEAFTKGSSWLYRDNRDSF